MLYIHILVVGFQQADETTMTDEQIAQLDLIRRIFVLKDLHSANYGVDGVGRLSIVDFKVTILYLHFAVAKLLVFV